MKERAKSTPISKEFEGVWEGTLSLPNASPVRLHVKLANGADGVATGTSCICVQRLPLEQAFTAVAQKGSTITLERSDIHAGIRFAGDLKGNELAGTWTMGPTSVPLTLKRTAQKATRRSRPCP